MAIAFFGAASAQYSGTSTPSIPTPASIPAGAIIICTLGGFFGSATLSLSGSGWTQLEGSVSNTGSHWIFYKIASGGEGSITATGDGSGCFGAGCTTVFTGVASTSSIIAHSAAVWGGVSHSTVTSPTVNNTGTSSACAVFVGDFYNGGAGHGQATPTNMSIAKVSGDDTTTGSTFSFYRLNAPTGSQSYSTAATDGHINWYGGDGLLFLAPAATAVNANAGAVSATAAASGPSLTLASGPAAGKASITAAALAPGITDSDSAPIGIATASSAAYAPSISTGVPAGGASASAAALAPTVTDSDSAPMGSASASAAASSPTVGIGAVADIATVSASAYSPSVTVDSNVSAGVATATGSALDPASSNTNAFAGKASAFAVANITIQPGTAHAIPAVVRMDAKDPDTIVYVDPIASTVDAYGADAQVAITSSAGLAQASVAIQDATGSPVSAAQSGDLIALDVAVYTATVVSSSNPTAGRASAVASVNGATLAIGTGEAVRARANVAAYSAVALTKGGTSDVVRVLRVGLTADRIYSIPHETREIKVKRT